MAKFKPFKKLKITIAMTTIVAVIIAISSGLLLKSRGVDIGTSALQWIFNVTVALIVIALVGWLVYFIRKMMKGMR